MRILLVEDDEVQGAAIQRRLEDSQYSCDWVRNREDAAAALRAYRYELIVLDRQLPDGDGLALLQDMASSKARPRVLVLSVQGTPSMRIKGLTAGADDYMAKPFEHEELIARVRALLRRSWKVQPSVLKLGRVELDMTDAQVTCAGTPLLLPRREYLILQTLMLRAERLTTRQALEEAVYTMEDTHESNTLDAQISRLRRRLRENGGGVSIVPLRGIGYLLTAQQQSNHTDT